MANLKFFLIAAAVLVVVFFLGKCSGSGKVEKDTAKTDCPADTVFIRQIDTLKVTIKEPAPKPTTTTDKVETTAEQDSLIKVLNKQLDYFEALTRYQKRRIADLEGATPPAAFENEVVANTYKGDTTTASGVKVGYEIDVLGYLQGNPCFTIDYFQSIVQPTERAKNRGIGLITGVRQDWKNDVTQWSPGLYYRRGAWLLGGKAWYNTSGFKFSDPIGAEVFTGVELSWKKKK